MIRSIRFVSVERMKAMKPSPSGIVVSILDNSEEHARPVFSGWGGVLVLNFEDVSEEDKNYEPGSWPDEPTDEQHEKFRMGKRERVSTLSDARRIVDFVFSHVERPEQFDLIAHCYGGISRSAAVAEWVSSRTMMPITFTGMKSTAHANHRLKRLLDKAMEMRRSEETEVLLHQGKACRQVP